MARRLSRWRGGWVAGSAIQSTRYLGQRTNRRDYLARSSTNTPLCSHVFVCCLPLISCPHAEMLPVQIQRGTSLPDHSAMFAAVMRVRPCMALPDPATESPVSRLQELVYFSAIPQPREPRVGVWRDGRIQRPFPSRLPSTGVRSRAGKRLTMARCVSRTDAEGDGGWADGKRNLSVGVDVRGPDWDARGASPERDAPRGPLGGYLPHAVIPLHSRAVRTCHIPRSLA